VTNRAAPVLFLRCVSDGAFSTARIRPQGVRLLCAADTSAAASPSAPPFNVWADRWLAAADIAETTRLDYQTTIDYAKKTFDGKLVRNLTVSDIFRHSYAKAVLEREPPVSFKWLQAQLGHSDLKTTMDTYGHLEAATKKAVATSLEGAFKV
jgi:hypothetical protein